MNKNLLTNGLAIALLLIGLYLDNTLLTYAGLFAFSGAITNWLAVHMLFEKVPGLYGSGVIPARFNEIKLAIKNLMMEQFFTDENIDRFIGSNAQNLNLAPMIERIDLNPSFDALVETVKASQFGAMLDMFGGDAALAPLRAPFIEKMQHSMLEISQSDNFQLALTEQISGGAHSDAISDNIEAIITQRLDELTPQLVKEMVQNMIKAHLGWLVVWGGLFGGIIGIFSALLMK